MKAIQLHEPGGPEALRLENVGTPEVGPGQALIKLAASGVNFIDVYHRTGLYKLDLPTVLGVEGAGIVESVASDVTGLKRGDRVAFAMARGSYAEYIALPAWQVVSVPDAMDLETAAGAMLQGMTAHYLTHSTYPLQHGHTCLIHAGAGGTGLLLIQMAAGLGARVIATASTPAKQQLARDAGADLAIGYEGFAARVREFTEGRGVDVVYDSVGKNTFEGSLDSLRVRGMLVSFGQSSGKVDPIEINILNPKGSLYATRPSLGHYLQTREELLWRAGDVLSGRYQFKIAARYPLSEAGEAHRALEGRGTTGKLILTI